MPASKIFRLLQKKRARIVLVESCTGGAAAAGLVAIPGASEHFCGSFVTYRASSKSRWLGISRALAARNSSVTPELTLKLARAALKKTPEAHVAAAVTGFLGPTATKGQLGRCYVALVTRGPKPIQVVARVQLPSGGSRPARQKIAAAVFWSTVMHLWVTSRERP